MLFGLFPFLLAALFQAPPEVISGIALRGVIFAVLWLTAAAIVIVSWKNKQPIRLFERLIFRQMKHLVMRFMIALVVIIAVVLLLVPEKFLQLPLEKPPCGSGLYF